MTSVADLDLYDACLAAGDEGWSRPIPREDLYPCLPGEEWRAVPGFEGDYEVSDLGRVRRAPEVGDARCERVRTLTDNGAGYMVVTLFRAGKSSTHTVHSLVAAAFIGPRPAGHVINHIDAARANNLAANLEYVTPGENSRHAAKLGRLDGRLRRCTRCRERGHNRKSCHLATDQRLSPAPAASQGGGA